MQAALIQQYCKLLGVYHMAAEREAKVFAEKILEPVGEKAERHPDRRWTDKKLAGFLAMQGNCYNGDLMVVGRAVNGWRRFAFPRDLADQSFRKEYASTVLKSVIGDRDQCPMNWVTKKNVIAISAFWRVIRMAIGGLSSQTLTKDNWPPRLRECWPSHLVWSNLYKLSPWEGGNPGGRLRSIQFAGCRDLLQLELNLYRPRRLLLLTGEGWAAPFLEALSPNDVGIDGFRYVERAGWLALADEGQAYFVVAPHPQGKPERPLTMEVLQAFQRLEHGP